ncbi:hypothetical protein COMNV_00084 [Commensalibacter sp. Nvir]|uniref:helix-turn-helix domain-containing protein n=1 Tax=Commensalibacter sp. Nvir TaxID=3069817 RepID=UPI002D249041|nr:hypothetical protein COMNV_00084 [Commensalibacter sp. Nvir]
MSIDKLPINSSVETIDQRIGQRIRMRRNALKFTLHKLASVLKLSFQQVQKYEKGTNRIVASRLLDVADALNVPINFFFDEIVDPIYIDKDYISDLKIMANDFVLEENSVSSSREILHSIDKSNVHNEEGIELLRAYYSIRDKKKRDRILQLIKNIAEE